MVSSEVERLASVELEECLLVEQLVACLHEVALCAEIGVLGLVELGDVGFSVLVFSLHEDECVVAALGGYGAAFVLGASGVGVEAHLLYFLVERLLGVVEGELLVLLFNLRAADAVAGLEAVEDGHAEIESDVLGEVVFHLSGEIIGGEFAGGVIVGA